MYPHIQPKGATFFVTFRLADSLPQIIINQLKATLDPDRVNDYQYTLAEHEQVSYLKTQKYYFGKFDHQLDDKPYGECYLKITEVAEVVKDKLHEFDGEFYKLLAYCIMPNHVHILLDLSIQLDGEDSNYMDLWKILKRIKGGSAVLANRLLNRSGPFWQRDSYDRVMRNANEIENVRNYILDNPIKAGLVDRREDFAHSYSLSEDI